MKHETARKQGLDPVYPEQHELGLIVFYDTVAGRYYDSSTDLYIELGDCRIPGGSNG
jgi:hypothetical protein